MKNATLSTAAECAKVTSWKNPCKTTKALLDDVAEGIRVLKTRDGFALSEEQILERARNIVAGLIGNFTFRSMDEDFAVAASAPKGGSAGVGSIRVTS